MLRLGTKEQKIALLEQVGITVQRSGGDTNYMPGEAIFEDSDVIDQAASTICGLINRYWSLAKLVREGSISVREATQELIVDLTEARDEAREWRRRCYEHEDLAYASRRLDEMITGTLERCGVRDSGRY